MLRRIAWLFLFGAAACALAGREWWDQAWTRLAGTEMVAEEAPLTAISDPIVRQVTLPTGEDRRLALNAAVGTRATLLKTVDQRLTQGTGEITGSTRLELVFGLSVEEVRDGATRLAVNYQRVRYSYDLAGESLVYDSQTPDQVPNGAQAFHGLVGNGFSFWIGADNRVVDLVGFGEFLQRCVRDVPAEQRENVLAQLTGASGDEGVSFFVDECLGLLPQNSERGPLARVGESWVNQSRSSKPAPITVQTQCTLSQADDKTATIEAAGTVAPGSSVELASASPSIHVRGGNLVGRCVFDSATGLPLESQFDRTLELTVRLPDGSEFEQRKQVVSTLRLLPGTATAAAPAPVGG